VPLKVEGEELVVATTDPMDLTFRRSPCDQFQSEARSRTRENRDRIEVLFNHLTAADATVGLAANATLGVMADERIRTPPRHGIGGPGDPPGEPDARARVGSRASDIHIEPFEEKLKVRYRVDGLLHEVESPPRQLKAVIRG
jgi:hypothetical protein